METLYVYLTAFIVLVLLLAFVPYMKEYFEMDINLNNMSCRELLQKSPQLASAFSQVTNNPNREHVLADMDRAVLPINTPDGVIYNDTDYCVLRRDKLPAYKIREDCVLRVNYPDGPSYQYQLAKANTDNWTVEPDGCIINPKDSWFPSFVDQAFYSKNQKYVDEVNGLLGTVQRKESEKQAIQGQLQNVTNQWQQSEADKVNMQASIASLQAQYQGQIDRYNALLKKMSEQYGRDAKSPGRNALAIRQQTGTTDNGIYYIDCGGIPTQIFCVMDARWDGGGWMLMMKMVPAETFQFSSGHWTQASVFNEGSLDLSEQDAKFAVFNSVGISDVMAIFKNVGYYGGSINSPSDNPPGPNDIGWCWLVKNWWFNRPGERVPALTGFNHARDANPWNPYDFDRRGLERRIWSRQGGAYRHVFGGIAHLGNGWRGPNTFGAVRWGFSFNNENDFASTDVWCGLGGGAVGGNCNINGWQGNQCFSAGDYHGCCGYPGMNRKVPALLFGR